MNLRQSTLIIAALLALVLAAPASPQNRNKTPDQHLRADASATARDAETAPASGTSAHDSQYLIGDNDVLGINVWNEKDLTKNITVRSDGNISMPLIGEVRAAGRTPVQLQEDIAAKLHAFITQPDVTVMVVQMNSRKFNILGRVAKPGSYPLTATTTVLDAIAIAGGFQDFAKQKSIYVLRHNPEGKESRLFFNYKSVIRGANPEQNIRLEPNDTIVVP